MVNARLIWLTIGLATPAAALAHGEEAVVLFLAQIVSFAIACLVSFFTLRRLRRTWLGVLASFGGVVVSWVVTWDLPFRENAIFIAWLGIGLPLLAGGLTVWAVRALAERKRAA